MYSDSQRRFVESVREEVYKNFLATRLPWQKATGAASQEINRHELASMDRGVLVALEHCEVNAVKQGKTLADFCEALFEREKFLLERASAVSPTDWNSITEMIDTPGKITEFFEEFQAEKWADLSPARQELFRVTLLHAKACEL